MAAGGARPASEPNAVSDTQTTIPLPAPVRHVVASGENFAMISRRYYGSTRFGMALWNANRGRVDAPNRLIVGTEITIPPPARLDAAYITPTSPATAPQRPALASTPRRDAQLQRASHSQPAALKRDDARPGAAPPASAAASRPAAPGTSP
jgi:hypothetical protein